MTHIDRVLVAALVVGVWVLVAVTLTSSPVQAEGQEMNRRAVERIVERCTVRGPVDQGFMYRGRISC
jgi:hypothetical protein